MRRILLIIEYDGLNFSGWQVQPGKLTVQKSIQDAIYKLTSEKVTLQSSGRTDTGVHALAMPALFTTSSKLPLTAFIYGLNGILPDEIAIKNASEVSLNFSFKDTKSLKHYRYKILNSDIRSPLQRNSSWLVKERLNFLDMVEASKFFEGTHDFISFRGKCATSLTTVRTIVKMDLRKTDDFIYINVYGEGFLKNMVRIIAGTLVEVGSGRLKPFEIKDIIGRKDRNLAGRTAPAHGLTLISVQFD